MSPEASGPAREPAREPDRFVAETYWSRSATGDLDSVTRAVRSAAAALSGRGTRIRLIRCTLSPADELCAWLFAAESEQAIRELARIAGLDVERIAPAVDVWPRARTPP